LEAKSIVHGAKHGGCKEVFGASEFRCRQESNEQQAGAFENRAVYQFSLLSPLELPARFRLPASKIPGFPAFKLPSFSVITLST